MTSASAHENRAWPSGKTTFVGLIGDPVVHSYSPLLHNTAFAASGLDWVYGAFTVQRGDVGSAIEGARALGFRGLSVTMPHKYDAGRIAEQASAKVTKLGVANTIVFRAGIAVAENTDGDGFVDDVRQQEGLDPSGLACGVIGAGGAARSIILALYEAGARSILVVNRTHQHAEEAAALAPGVARIAQASELAQVALVVNATPQGMAGVGGLEDGLDQVGELLGTGQLVIDSIYHPAQTPFLARASARGAQTRNGLGMLAGQAALQFELWTGEVAPRAAMRDAVQKAAATAR